MKFSIIIPCYNVEKYIEKTLNSVLAQTYFNYEIILVDDGSSDKTFEIIQKYADSYKKIKYLTQKNRGVSFSRNKGIKESKGDYLYFLDGDDVIEPFLLEKASTIFIQNKVEMFSFGYDKKENGVLTCYQNPKFQKNILNSKEYLKNYLKKEINYNISSFIIKKSIIKKINFNTALNIGEDLDFQLKILLKKNFNIYYSTDIFFHYIKRNNSATTTINFFNQEINELFYLEKIKHKMLANNINEFEEYYVIRFFSFLKRTAFKKLTRNNYIFLKNELKKYEYNLKKLKLTFKKKNILLTILKYIYKLSPKLVFFIFRLARSLKLGNLY